LIIAARPSVVTKSNKSTPARRLCSWLLRRRQAPKHLPPHHRETMSWQRQAIVPTRTDILEGVGRCF